MSSDGNLIFGEIYTTVIFPVPMHREIREQADALGISFSEQVINLLNEQRLTVQLKPIFEFIEKQDQLNQKFSIAINPLEQEKQNGE